MALTHSDLHARYGRGPWQIFKWLIDPFALTGVYLIVVTLVIDEPSEAPGLSVACAVVPFQLVMMATIGAFDSLRLRGPVIANMNFARVLVPLAAALTESIAFFAALSLFVVMMLVYGVAPTTALLWLPALILVTPTFAVAIAYPAALAGLWLPDLREFVVSLVRTLYFVAPGLVALSEVFGQTRDVLKLNPLTGLFEAYRSVFLYGEAPAAWELGYPLAFAALIASVCVPLYRLERPHLAKLVA